MRIGLGGAALVGIGLALGLMRTPAAAQGAWCSEDMNARNCGFYTLEQCRAAASGLGANCYASPYVTRGGAAAQVQPKRVKHARHRH